MVGMLLDAGTGDLCLESWGIVVGESESQTAEVVVMGMRGDLKEYPLLGGEARKLTGGNGDVMWSGRVRGMLKECGVECDRVKMEDDGTISIER